MYADLARHAVTAEHEIVVTVRHDSYYAGVARKGFMILREFESMPYPTEAQARAEANRYYSQIRAGGLDAFARTVSLYRADSLAGTHPRQAEILRQIPRKHRGVVLSRAHLLQNISGGILSGNLYTAASEYRNVGPWELERMSRRDNHAAMAACAKQGCEGCSKSTR